MEEFDYFSKKYFKECIKEEVFKKIESRSIFKRIWAKYFKPETNSVYLIRKYLYKLHSSPNSFSCRLLRVKLMSKYGIHVSSNTRIGLGLEIHHPSSIMITNAKIGRNCILFHNVTIGAKYQEAGIHNSPTIGNNVVFYSNSACYGNISICDNVSLGSFSCVISDISVAGTYVGIGKGIRRID